MDIAAAAQSVQGKVVGVIIPPPEIRAVVDKTAQFVAKHGKSFEQKILNSNEGKTAKFNFMKELDPYHAYYEMKIREIEEAIAAGKDPNSVTSKPIAAALPITAVKANDPEKKRVTQVSSNVRPSILNPVALLAKNPPKEAPYPLEFTLNQPSGVSAAEIDIIKLTAQYTAVNGREFLASLAQREQRNPLFDFLKPTHLLFGLFTSLVDAYVKLANPTEAQRNRVKQRQNRQFVLETCVQRWSWTHAEAERQRSSQNQDDVERLAFQNIDWNDFAVVEVINFDENELLDLPGLTPVTDSDVQAAIGRRMPPPPPPPPPSVTVAGSSEHGPPPPPPPPPLPAKSVRMDDDEGHDEKKGGQSNEDEDGEDAIKVVSDYKPRIAGSTSAVSGPAMTIDPITGRAIPVDQLQEHMRIQLLDPKWKEEQKRFQEKQSGYSGSLGTTEGDTIAESLKLLAKKRGDIFGQSTATVGADSARRIAEAEMREQQHFQTTSSLQWDGNSASAASFLAKREEVSSSVFPSTHNGVYGAFQAGVTVTAQGTALPPPPLAPSLPLPIASVPLSMPPPPPPLPMVAPPLVPLAPVVSAAGLVPPPPPLPLPMGLPLGMMPPPLTTAASAAMTVVVTGQSSVEQGPSAKRPRVAEEDAAGTTEAMPAEEFAKLHPGPILLRVSLPMDSSAGQTVELSLSDGVWTSVKVVKEQLAAQFLANMPVNKLQLKSAQVGFWKDAATLASLNVAGGSGLLVEASVKSRGGKR